MSKVQAGLILCMSRISDYCFLATEVQFICCVEVRVCAVSKDALQAASCNALQDALQALKMTMLSLFNEFNVFNVMNSLL